MELLEATLRELVAIDSNGDYDAFVRKFNYDKAFHSAVQNLSDKVNFNATSYDGDYLKSLTNVEVVALIRTITWIDTLGSVAACPTLLDELKSRDYPKYDDVLDYVFKNKVNWYSPCGFLYCSEAKSLAEYRLLDEAHHLKVQIGELESKLRRTKRLIRELPKNTKNLVDAIRRNDSSAIHALVEKKADLLSKYPDGKTLLDKIAELKEVEFSKYLPR